MVRFAGIQRGWQCPPSRCQRIFVVRREDRVYLVPFVENEHTVFLKTIIPGCKATKEYIGRRRESVMPTKKSC